MAKETLSVNSENILPIIKKWLYSERDIFLRELIANSCDAIEKHRTISKEREDFRIDITVDRAKKTLSIKDNGIGMTKDEVRKYIADIAFSGAREFLDKYKKGSKEGIIGHFGLGFYSAYMVASKVEIKTKSESSKKGVFWRCSGSSEYEIEDIDIDKRSTEIVLYIEDESFLDNNKIESTLEKYCPFLPFPIYLNNSLFNKTPPLWIKDTKDIPDKEYIEFYKRLYPLKNDPIFWIHLNIDYPFQVRGILYFPKLTNFSKEDRGIKLFSNRVYITDNAKDILPDFLTMLQGVLDSVDIPLNVSRSSIQVDPLFKKLGNHISKKICDHLKKLLSNDREKFFKIWEDISTVIKVGVMQDENFYKKAKELLFWKTNKKNWVTIEEYLEKKKTEDKSILYTDDEHSHFLKLFSNDEVIFTNRYIDVALLNFLEGSIEGTKFQRIDGALKDEMLDKSKEKTLLDSEGRSEKSRMEDFIRSALDGIEVEVKSLSTTDLPGFLMMDEKERRLREYFNLIGQDIKTPVNKKFVVNSNNKLVSKAFAIKKGDEKTARSIIVHIYNMALLSQKELDPKKLPDLISHSNELMERLAELSS